MFFFHRLMVAIIFVSIGFVSPLVCAAEDTPLNHRKPESDKELKYWLQIMVWHHRFSEKEIQAATGLSPNEIRAALKKFDIRAETRPSVKKNGPLLMMPYPGGRHPRIGFLEGAIRPQRETKISVFMPWDRNSYVVLDVPEAIWSNLGLTYLAHTHVPTIWNKQGIELKKLEWSRGTDGSLSMRRKLPTGIEFSTRVMARRDAIRLEMTLTNGTKNPLSGLRVQNCVMLKAAKGFEGQTNDNKVFRKPYVACRGADSNRWIITAWTPCERPWANERCPCLHSDPKFSDCPPTKTQRLRGWLSFYEGIDIQAEFKRIEKTGWRTERDWLKSNR